MNTRKTILATTAIVGVALFGYTQVQAETTLFEKIRNAVMPSASTSMEQVTDADIQRDLDSMVPPAIEPAAGGDMETWQDIPAPEVNNEGEGQRFIPVESEEANMGTRSGFDDPVSADDLNAIESAAGANVGSDVNSAMGFEDPSAYSNSNMAEQSGADIADIAPAAGEEGDMMDEAADMAEEAYTETEEVVEDIAEGAEDLVNEMGEVTEEGVNSASEMLEDESQVEGTDGSMTEDEALSDHYHGDDMDHGTDTGEDETMGDDMADPSTETDMPADEMDQ